MLDYQVTLGGLTLGTGTVYPLEDITGMGLGDKRTRIYPVAGGDGVDFGREWRDGPIVTLEGLVETPGDPAACWAAFLALRSAFDGSSRTTPKATQPLGFRFPGTADVTIEGRPDRFAPVTLSQLVLGLIPWTGTFVCAELL